MLDYCKKIINKFRKQQPKQKPLDVEEQINNLFSQLTEDVIKIEIGADIVPFGDFIISSISEIRENYFENTGYIFPIVRVVDNSELQENEYRYFIQGKFINSKFVIPKKEDVISDIKAEFDIIYRDYIDEIFTNDILEKYIAVLNNYNNYLVTDIFRYYDNSNLKRILINLLQMKKPIKNISYIASKICQKNAEKFDKCKEAYYFKPLSTETISDMIRDEI